MKKVLMSLFGESSQVSMVRLMAFITVLTGCYIAISRGPEELGVISVLLGTGFSGKVAQKAIEIKKGDKDEPTN